MFAGEPLGNHQFAAVLFFERHGVVQRDDGALGLVVGRGCVVMRCSHRPGAVISANSDPRCLAAKRMISYETPAITGSSTMRMPNLAQNVVTGNTATPGCRP